MDDLITKMRTGAGVSGRQRTATKGVTKPGESLGSGGESQPDWLKNPVLKKSTAPAPTTPAK